jgi:manganese transport system ATP-binding protein
MHGLGEESTAAIVVADLRCGYGTSTFRVLDGIGFSIDPGEMVALVGPNGCGKTTLLRCLIGEVPMQGTVVVHGNRPPRGYVSYLPQVQRWERDYPITVGEVVAAGRRAHRGLFGRLGPRDREAIDAVIEELGLPSLHRRPLSELSGGQFRRVLIARILAHDADVVLLDEPFAGLDRGSALRVIEALQRRAARGATVLASVHELDLVRIGFPRVLGLDQFMVHDGRPDEILNDKPVGMFRSRLAAVAM